MQVRVTKKRESSNKDAEGANAFLKISTREVHNALQF